MRAQWGAVQARLLLLGLDNAGKTTILKQLSSEGIQNVAPTQARVLPGLCMKELARFVGLSMSAVQQTRTLPLSIGRCGAGLQRQIGGQEWLQAQRVGHWWPEGHPPVLVRLGSPHNLTFCTIARTFCMHKGMLLISVRAAARRTCRRNYFEGSDALIFVIDSFDRKRLTEAGEELSYLLAVRLPPVVAMSLCTAWLAYGVAAKALHLLVQNALSTVVPLHARECFVEMRWIEDRTRRPAQGARTGAGGGSGESSAAGAGKQAGLGRLDEPERDRRRPQSALGAAARLADRGLLCDHWHWAGRRHDVAHEADEVT